MRICNPDIVYPWHDDVFADAFCLRFDYRQLFILLMTKFWIKYKYITVLIQVIIFYKVPIGCNQHSSTTYKMWLNQKYKKGLYSILKIIIFNCSFILEKNYIYFNKEKQKWNGICDTYMPTGSTRKTKQHTKCFSYEYTYSFFTFIKAYKSYSTYNIKNINHVIEEGW